MGYKTIKFEEFDERVQQYWLPADLDLDAVRADVTAIAENWGTNKGFLRLVFDDATQVLTEIDQRLESGAFQELWATGETPEGVVAESQRQQVIATFPTSFNDMWMTYNRWDDYVQYAAEKGMDENTDFLVAVEAYRQSPSVPAQLEIYENYVVDGAPRQVNLDYEVVQAIEQRADGGADVFDGAQQFVFQLLGAEFHTKFLPWLTERV